MSVGAASHLSSTSALLLAQQKAAADAARVKAQAAAAASNAVTTTASTSADTQSFNSVLQNSVTGIQPDLSAFSSAGSAVSALGQSLPVESNSGTIAAPPVAPHHHHHGGGVAAGRYASAAANSVSPSGTLTASSDDIFV